MEENKKIKKLDEIIDRELSLDSLNEASYPSALASGRRSYQRYGLM